MEDALETLVLPGLVVLIIVGTVILARLDRRAEREQLEAEEKARPQPNRRNRA